ncbi:MAG: hypothetical protein GWO07_02390 [Candidatus Dadabacteria bacterium]|nr:hypothetical protein [Candidatus Dadabacteria bacterium]NIS07617.1 hypothetical protein [Candidatus Dadabacteria bacterium]NIV42071.1 hypothetical protein [Candidatus Dadabacteria bacterium]NIX16476.1 hypothetical protein [Candidatus Dadabacteria bacterium]NIY21255.1 hypothetical protein [Candidatus Dadabacteria bacterium]
MPYKLKVFFLSLLSVPLLLTNAATAEVKTSEIEQLKQQILEIQKQNAQQIEQLQNKIESLESDRASNDLKIDEFIAKKEAEDAYAWYKGMKAGYKKGFFMETADGNFKTKFNIRGQFRAQYLDPEDDAGENLEFDLARVRLQWKGNAFRPWFKYKLQLDVREDSFNLRDLVFDFAYNKQFVPRVGQYKVPFNREQLTSSSALQFVDRSILDRNFAFGRDAGIGLHGKIQKMFLYELGLFQGEGRNSDEGDENGLDTGLLWSGRIMFSPLGKDLKPKHNFVKEPTIQIGAAVAGIESEITGDDGNSSLFDETDNRNFRARGADFAALGATDLQLITWAVDLALLHPRANLEASYIGADYDPTGVGGDAYDQGFRVQAGVFLMPKLLEVAARYAYVDFDDAVGSDDSAWEITPAISYYLGNSHRWKIQADYSYIEEEDIDGITEEENRFRLQLQAYF